MLLVFVVTEMMRKNKGWGYISYCFVIGFNYGVFRPFINLNVILCRKEKMSCGLECRYECIWCICYTSCNFFLCRLQTRKLIHSNWGQQGCNNSLNNYLFLWKFQKRGACMCSIKVDLFICFVARKKMVASIGYVWGNWSTSVNFTLVFRNT